MNDPASTSVSQPADLPPGCPGTSEQAASGFTEFIVDSLPEQSSSGSAAAQFLTVLRRLPHCLVDTQDVDTQDNVSALTKMAGVLRRAGQLNCLAWFDRQQGKLSDKPAVFRIEESPEIELELRETATRAVTSRMTETCGVSRGGTSWIVIASPVQVEAGSGGCLVGSFGIGRESPAWLAGQIELAALILGHSLTDRNRIASERELAAAAAVIDLTARLEKATTFLQACQILVDEMSRHTGCPRVAIGTLSAANGSCRFQACSGDRRSPFDNAAKAAMEAAFDEIIIRDEDTLWPPESEMNRTGLLTHRRLVDEGYAECIIGTPLRNRDGTVFGAWLFLGDTSLSESLATRQFIHACEYRLADTLCLIKRAQPSFWKRSREQFQQKAGSSPRCTVICILTVLAGLCALPVPHHVRAECELQPMTRRFIAAPFDGTLEKTFVEPGDLVEANQLLARIDDREINLELAGADAEHHRASKERDTHLAKRDIADAQLARYDMERLQLRQRLLAHRSENLEIRSPIDGLVIDGDLKRSEGVPLTTGDTLFEIAPLDRMIVEVAIPETGIAHVEVGQNVSISLEGFRSRALTGPLVRIHPRSEMKDDQHVFIGEVEFDHANERLLPGMHGTASIDSGYEPMGWIILHEPFEAFLFWMGW